jgi:CPA1 family monovalent cation:H+ antiporter
MSQIGAIELVFLLLLVFVVVFGLLAGKLKTPYPIVMVIGGLILGFVPGIPAISLNPDVIFLVVLPSLLYSSAWTTSWREFRYNIISILFLAFGLVVFTVLGVALLAPKVLTGFDWRLGLALGAVVAPTDAIAATSIGRRVGLPERIVDVLEGESLINDASGLLALQFATAIVVERRIPTATEGALTFLWLVAGGIGLGLLIAWIIHQIEKRIDDGPIEIVLSILAPYAVYLAADALHASGVLAVVACGLFLSRRSASFFSPAVRLQTWSVWQALTFILNGVVFVLIGLQLPGIRLSIREYSLPALLRDGLVFSVLLILLRIIWVFPGAGLAYFFRTRLAHQKEKRPQARQIFVVGWTGMRGVVSLAAAIALPAMSDKAPFPQRDLIVFLTFCVIVVTLIFQGLTLPPLIRALGLVGAPGHDAEEREARRLVLNAAVTYLQNAKKNDNEESAELYEDLVGHYRERLASLQPGAENHPAKENRNRHIELSLKALRIERQTAIRLRDSGQISDGLLRRIERELDLGESRWSTREE